MNHHKQMRRDCRWFMRGAIGAAFLHRLTNVAAPMMAAWLIGDMANHLLNLDVMAIRSSLPGFLCAVFFQVVGAALFNLALNLLLTKQGFAYDAFLMEKFIRLPVQTIKTASAGAVMERLEEDSAALCWNQMILIAYPGAIILCAAAFGFAWIENQFPIAFVLTILLFAAVPIFRAKLTGKTRAELTRQISEYQDDRKQLEQELYDSASFSRCYGLDRFFIHRLTERFRKYLAECGRLLYHLDAKSEILDYVCTYGVQIGTIVVGAILIGEKQLTVGGLLSGYLMIPAVQQCCGYVKEWVTEMRSEKKLLERLQFFYSDSAEEWTAEEPLQNLSAEDLSFAYPGSDIDVLNGCHFHMTGEENVRLTGENGSGKTTFLSLLAGLYRPRTGTVCGGASVSQIRRSVAWQPQEGAVFSGTIWENLFLPECEKERAQKLLRKMGFEKPLNYEVTSEGENLSPGERKKLLLVRALLRDAPFLLLDEPLNHLDEQGRKTLFSYLENRTGVLIISHEDIPNSVMNYENRIVCSGAQQDT